MIFFKHNLEKFCGFYAFKIKLCSFWVCNIWHDTIIENYSMAHSEKYASFPLQFSNYPVPLSGDKICL